LEPGIDPVVAKHGSFPLSSEERVRIAVMDNTIPVRGVSQSICEQEEEQRTILNVIFIHARTAPSSGGSYVFAFVAVTYPMRLSNCGQGP
jgi:hypothetical protein